MGVAVSQHRRVYLVRSDGEYGEPRCFGPRRSYDDPYAVCNQHTETAPTKTLLASVVMTSLSLRSFLRETITGVLIVLRAQRTSTLSIGGYDLRMTSSTKRLTIVSSSGTAEEAVEGDTNLFGDDYKNTKIQNKLEHKARCTIFWKSR